MSDELVTLTIDDKEVQVPKGTLLVEAAKRVGIDIPIFCYHSKMKPVGACRMCLVEIEKMPRLQTACTSPVAEGMVVHTNTPNVVGAQNGVLEFLLANHPLDCPICDKGGQCPLQDNTFKFGRGTSRFREDKRRLGKAIPLSDRIVLDRERCIMCYRCVRFQDEVVGDAALAVISRGSMSQIGVLDGETFQSPFSGNTVDICPVGALLSRQYRFRSRPWDLQRTPSVCVGCAVGCNVELHSREQQIKRMVPRENMAVNNEWLCDYGRFETVPIGIERLREPAVEGKPASWDQALNAAAGMLRHDAVELVASPALTNEALSVLKVIADTLKAPLTVWPNKTGRVRGSIADLVASKTIILSDFDPWTELPVLALRIREAVKAGARLYFAGSKRNGLYRDTRATFASLDELLKAQPDMPQPISILGVNADDHAARLEATGMVGSPATAANGYAMADLPTARFQAPVLLLAGNESWPMEGVRGQRSGGKGIISLRWEAVREAEKQEAGAPGADGQGPSGPQDSGLGTVVLPITHPYEQTGTITNLEGRVQTLKAGAAAVGGLKSDWMVLAELASALGASPAQGLAGREIVLV